MSRCRRGSARTRKMSAAGALIRRETVTGWYSSAAIALLYSASPYRPRPAAVLPSLRRAGRPSLIAPRLPAPAGKRHAGRAQGQPGEGDLDRSEATISQLDPPERGTPDEGQQGQA